MVTREMGSPRVGVTTFIPEQETNHRFEPLIMGTKVSVASSGRMKIRIVAPSGMELFTGFVNGTTITRDIKNTGEIMLISLLSGPPANVYVSVE